MKPRPDGVNAKESSLLLQRRIRTLRVERERICDQIRQATAELRELTPRRPHTGIMAAVVAACKASDRPLTSREIADRCSHLDFHRVQVMAHQAAREGYLAKRVGYETAGTRAKYRFTYVRDAKGALRARPR